MTHSEDMSSKKDTPWLRRHWPVLCFAAGIVLIAISQTSFLYSRPHRQLFVIELGFASIISGLFGLTIERYQRQEFVKLVNKEREELKRDIFLYAYGHELPEALRKEIKEQVLNQPFFRSDLKLEWDFFEVPDDSTLVRIEKTYRYDVTNHCAHKQDFWFRFTEITASEKELRQASKFEFLRIKSDSQPTIYLPQDMQTEHPSNLEPHVRRLLKDIPVPAGKSITVCFKVHELKRIFSDDSYAPTQPVHGRTLVRFKVNAPLSLEFSAAFKGKSLSHNIEHDPPTDNRWDFNEAIYPHQAISFSWSPV